MGQTDLVARAGLVSWSRFFILPICVAWPRSGSTHFPGQYTLFVETFMFWLYGAGKRRKTRPASWDEQLMVKSQYAYRASSLSWNEPTQQASQKILYNQKLQNALNLFMNKLTLLLRQASSWWVSMPHLISSKDAS